jgi:DNA mismatch repair ATPase MutL
MEKSLIEVVANSLDAGAKKICFTISEEIRISDYGRGIFVDRKHEGRA